MATKKELQAQADEAGVEYDPKANKADLEQALADAGVEVSGDPRTVWVKNRDTGVVFSVREGTPTYARVFARRNESRYEKASKPGSRQSRRLVRRGRNRRG